LGAGSRRANRRLKRSPAALGGVASDAHPLLLPAVSVAYALAFAAGLLAIERLVVGDSPGPWFELLAAAVLVVCLLTVALLLKTGWRRHREGLNRRGILWAGGAAAAAVVGVVAVLSLIETAQIAAVISGADVRLTRPVIRSLPRPPGTTLLDEHPGLADTESISQDIKASNLDAVISFYEARLPEVGWVEEKASAGTPMVRFTKVPYVLSIGIDPPSSSYTITLDRLNPSLFETPSPSASPSP
jgi:hypothetical protein